MPACVAHASGFSGRVRKRVDVPGGVVRGLRAADRHGRRRGRVDLPVALLGREQVAAPILLADHVADAPRENRVVLVPEPAGAHGRVELGEAGL